MSPIPSHLAAFAWYPRHLAWLASQGLTPRHDPGDAEPERADLSGSVLDGEDIGGADIRSVRFIGSSVEQTDFCGANLCGADFGGARMAGACLVEAMLVNTTFHAADLTRAEFDNARRNPGDHDIHGWTVVAGLMVAA